MDSENSLTMELLRELKEQNKRLANSLKISVISFSLLICLIVGIFIWYINQYDFTTTIEQTGVYTLSDSEGNVISSDISHEQAKEILEYLNGDNKNN